MCAPIPGFPQFHPRGIPPGLHDCSTDFSTATPGLPRGLMLVDNSVGKCGGSCARHRDKLLFADTETGKDLAQQVIGGHLSGYFRQCQLALAQVFSEQFASTVGL